MSNVHPKLELEEISLPSWPFTPLGIAYGLGKQLPLEILYAEHARVPNSTQLRSAWKSRQDSRGVPLIVVVLQGNKAHVCGPSGEDPTVYPNLDPGQVARVCLEALEQPSRHDALRSLRDSLGALGEEGLPGLRNEGFLATHELTTGVPNRSDWKKAGTKAREVLNQTGKELLSALGFSIERLDTVTDVLKIEGRKNGVAVLLTGNETPESGSERIPGNMSPVSYALARADEENLKWVVLVHGRKIRLYPVDVDVGVGRRGRTETFLECHTGLIPDDQAAFLWLLFSADALKIKGSLASILEDSKDFAGGLATRLRERIYNEVVPRLSEGIAGARGLKKPTAQQLSETYQMAMHVLFRLLFVAYGEDKDLLPYRFNGLYQKRSLKTKAKELLELANTGHKFGQGETWWQEIKTIFHAIDKGNKSWGVPAYNGGLFSSNKKESRIGAELEKISLTDSVFGPVLQNLLLVPTKENVLGPVDFRSLGVREFGTIYEGLLESELSVAESDLTIEAKGKNQGIYRPCQEGEEAVLAKDEVYLHNASGARKSTGSYYTKHFAVEHLLDRALEPALDDHFSRLDDLDDLEAAESLFDFKVADIAMGSGHFLIAAIDRIEARFSGYLVNRSLPQIGLELEHIRSVALEALGELADTHPEIEDNSLLRRQIARRCIYGVDLNEVATQLARLAIWIHTFVPGLPLSLLDRNLVHGNSLIGIGQLSELEDKVKEESGEGTISIFEAKAADFIGDAEAALKKLGRLTDASFDEIKEAQKIWADADVATAPAKALCDILTATRIEGAVLPFDFTRWEQDKDSVFGGKDHTDALSVLKGMNPIHFPVAFPEVFLRGRAGFDVILGNPPWEKAHVDSREFWARHFPGLRGLTQKETEAEYQHLASARPDLEQVLEYETRAAAHLRKALLRGPFPGMGSGHPDLYKAFSWRFWDLSVVRGGWVGVVLPRSMLALKGGEAFRKTLLQGAASIDITNLLNMGRWVFDMEPRYTIALVVFQRGAATAGMLRIKGPYRSESDYKCRIERSGASFMSEEVMSWTTSASIPLLPSERSADTFKALRKSLRLGANERSDWRVRAIQGDMNSTTGKEHMDFVSDMTQSAFWPVFKGESFGLWDPDRGLGSYYAWIDSGKATSVLQERRMKASKNQKSAFYECGATWCSKVETLPCRNPRIAYRRHSRATDTRTLIVALIPPKTVLVDQAPFLVFSRGNEKAEAFLLGVLSSIPLDWYARRFIETDINFFLFDGFPVPVYEKQSLLAERVIELAGRLACPDDRYTDWAKEVGVKYGPLEEDEKQDMIHELDSVVAHLYGLTQNHLTHIFETFHVGWEYQSRLEETLKHYNKWKAKA